ncbi:MAG: GNAT family N-acetyltransferase [Bacteroidales bacterium]|nr:GNAT family N-acetyltransferase [Bacteroidales bacterium]
MRGKVVKFSFKNKKLLNEAFKIRTKVFIEEQNTDEEEEFDGLDAEATHFIIFSEEKPAGTSRVRITKEGIKIERVAVIKNFRGKNIGINLVQFIMKEYIPKKMKIYLNSQVQAITFYEKLGFKKIGELFYEANIEHYKMEYSE